MKTIKAFVGTRTGKDGKERIVVVHFDRGYIWDKLFEHFCFTHKYVGIDDYYGLKTRKQAIAKAKTLGYNIRPCTVTIDD